MGAPSVDVVEIQLLRSDMLHSGVEHGWRDQSERQ